jgi:HlyD family secretion protein
MVSRIISSTIVLLILGGAAWALWPRPTSVDLASIGRGTLTISVEEEGLARIRDVFRVSAPIAGRMGRLTLHAGDPVQRGQIVASIEPASPALLDERSRRVAQASLEAAKAAVTLATANLAQAEAENDYAQANMQRNVSLAERGVVSTSIEQQVTMKANLAQRTVDAARATLVMRQQDLESARAALFEGDVPSGSGACCATVLSPVDGLVLAVLNESEQVVQPGTALLELGDPTDLEIVVDLLSTDAVRVMPHAAASIESWGGTSLRAEVVSINPTAFTKVSALGIEEQRTEVVLHLLDPPQHWARLGHGFRVVANIVVWQGNDQLLVPVSALFRRGTDWAVFVVQDGQARLRTVSLAQMNSDNAAVVAGLDENEQVIVHPADTIADGTSVSPQTE